MSTTIEKNAATCPRCLAHYDATMPGTVEEKIR